MHHVRQNLYNPGKINTLETPEISGFITKNDHDKFSHENFPKLTKEGVLIMATLLANIK